MKLQPIKNGISWKFALIFISVLVLTAQIILIVVWRFKLFGVNDKYGEWVRVVDPSSDSYSSLMAGPGEVIQEIACTKLDNQCYYVIDGASKYGSGYGRSLMVEPLYTHTLSEVDLDNLNYEALTKENARQWAPKLGQITVDYIKVLAVQPFITGTFAKYYEHDHPELATNSTVRILAIGLGGAVLNNFYAFHFPQHQIKVLESEPTVKYLAEKYFGMTETENHKVVVVDPLKYLGQKALKNKLKAEKKFDFIAVDSCYRTQLKDAQCPTEEYWEAETVAALKENLNENGTIVVNVFSLIRKRDTFKQHKLANHEHDLLMLFREHFGSCYYVHMAHNLILSCTQKSRPHAMTQKFYEDAFVLAKLPDDLNTFSSNDLEKPKIILDIEAL
uniref:Uncharacterized protein n=1 Tax=Ditylenchus dipsaci TaxID=166011 RepID=A0A915D2U4_9BILA